jgi:hypothetical protein
MTQRWRTLVLLYPVLDARYGSGLGRKRAQRVMGREERGVIERVIEGLPAIVADWSDGLATLDPVDVIEVRRKVKSLSASGGGKWWVGPRECREELLEWASGDRYDHVYALWPCEPDVPQCGWGCTAAPSEATFGAGFSSISTDHWRTLATDPDPSQGYVHEWLHAVEWRYRELGLSERDLPPLHDAGEFTSARSIEGPPFGRTFAEYHDGGAGLDRAARTWSPWYRDYMTGRLRPTGTDPSWDGEPIGLTPERWALRGAR